VRLAGRLIPPWLQETDAANGSVEGATVLKPNLKFDNFGHIPPLDIVRRPT